MIQLPAYRFVTLVVLLAGLGWVLGACALPAYAQTQSTCRPADATSVPAHLEYRRSLVVSTDSVAVATRAAFQLEATAASKVVLVTKNSICAIAATALNAVRGTPGVVRRVWVYNLGTNYAVEDPTLRVVGQEYAFYLFEKHWNPKPVLMY